jgi:hypothetical protein
MNFDNISDAEAAQYAAALIRQLRTWLNNQQILLMRLIGDVSNTSDAYRAEDLQNVVQNYLVPV